jgi:hypothetical protein
VLALLDKCEQEDEAGWSTEAAHTVSRRMCGNGKAIDSLAVVNVSSAIA